MQRCIWLCHKLKWCSRFSACSCLMVIDLVGAATNTFFFNLLIISLAAFAISLAGFIGTLTYWFTYWYTQELWPFLSLYPSPLMVGSAGDYICNVLWNGYPLILEPCAALNFSYLVCKFGSNSHLTVLCQKLLHKMVPPLYLNLAHLFRHATNTSPHISAFT